MFFGSVAAFWVIIALLPVGLIFFSTFFVDGSFSLSAYSSLFGNSMLIKSLGNSVVLALTVAALTTAAGVGLGVLLGKTDIWLGRSFAVLLSIPLLIPPYILAFAYADLFGEWFFGFWGVVFVLFGIYLPIPLLLTMFYMRQIDPALEEAGLLVSGWREVFVGITLPLIKPAVLFAFLLVFILTFGEYSVANFLRYPVFSTQSFVYFAAFYDFKAAAVAAFPIILVVAVAVMLAHLWRKKNRFMSTNMSRQQKIELGKWKPVCFTLLAGMTGVLVMLPLMLLVQKSGDIDIFWDAFQKAKDPLFRSLLLSALGATFLILFGFVSAYIIEQKLFVWWKWFDGSILFLFALPSTLLGIALILLWNTPYTNFIYTTPLIILFGYVGKYLALSSKVTEAGLSQIPQSFTEAAQLNGAGWYQVLWYILLPLSKEILLLAWGIGFIFTLREDTLSMLLYPPGMDTLPVYIFTQMANGAPALIASYCLLMVTVILLPILVFALFSIFKRRVV